VRHSTYLQYLPAPYQDAVDDEDLEDLDRPSFLERFLMIFESILAPIELTIDNLAQYFDPRLAPPELLPWLAGWVGLELNANWPTERQRQLIAWAVTLYGWRGTRRGLHEHLRLYTGRTPLVVEHFGARTPSIEVTIVADAAEEFDSEIVRQIIEFQKPAHVAYTLRFLTDVTTGAYPQP
jgi:phage tail-like protein